MLPSFLNSACCGVFACPSVFLIQVNSNENGEGQDWEALSSIEGTNQDFTEKFKNYNLQARWDANLQH